MLQRQITPNIADSMGTAMTADFMLFLLQDEEMKARGEIIP